MATNVNVNTGGSSGMVRRDLTGRSTIAGMFNNRADAEAAIHALKDAGFASTDVGVAMRDRTAQGEIVEDTGTKAAEGATSGALGGGLLGGVVGFLVGLGALAIPGIGPVVAGGMLASAFGLAGGTAVAGAGIGAAAGGLVGALVGMGIPEEEARHFESSFRSGGTLVTVRAGARAMDAMAILERYGADTGPGSVGASSASGVSSTVTTPGHDTRHTGSGETTTGAVAGGLAGAAAGAAIGTMIAPGPGTAAGAAIGGTAAAISGTAAGAAIGTAVGAMGGAAAGKGIHEARPADHKDEAAEGAAGGGLAGAAAGAVIGTVVAGPGPGTIAGAAIGGATGAATGGSAGAKDDDEDDRTTTTTVTRR